MGYRKQNGFTLIELLVTMAILGFVSAAMAMTFSVVTKVSTEAMGQNQALTEVHMAGSWISRDVQNAKTGKELKTTAELQATDNKALCFMQCSVWDSAAKSFKQYTDNITYRIDNGMLIRTNQPENGGTITQTTIAHYIEGPSENVTYFAPENITTKYFILTVTANYNNSTFGKFV
jgi:prepilin-type N-terminal cleavage/methylation domain-containing protein